MIGRIREITADSVTESQKYLLAPGNAVKITVPPLQMVEGVAVKLASMQGKLLPGM